jgi:hypothetical protein
MEHLENEGINNFLGRYGVPLPQRSCPYRGLEALGRATDHDA